jgi:hypothetical protein
MHLLVALWLLNAKLLLLNFPVIPSAAKNLTRAEIYVRFLARLGMTMRRRVELKQFIDLFQASRSSGLLRVSG